MIASLNHKGTIRLHGPRINLQPFTMDDAMIMFKNWAHDPDVTRYMTWFPHKDIQETVSIISQWENSYSNLNFYHWAILLRKIDEPIGSISVVEMDEENQRCEVGYCIGKNFWHQGYTSEALKEVIKFLFEQVGFKTITAHHDVRNPHSGAVMRKCGMELVENRTNIGLTKEGEPMSCAYYSICRSNFKIIT